MKPSIQIGLLIFCCAIFSGWRSVSSVRSDTPLCDSAKEIITAAGGIKVGMTRQEVEKHFSKDGGMQFPRSTRYLYPRCDHIKLEIDFEPTGDQMFSPNDKVTKVSKPFLDYPVSD